MLSFNEQKNLIRFFTRFSMLIQCGNWYIVARNLIIWRVVAYDIFCINSQIGYNGSFLSYPKISTKAVAWLLTHSKFAVIFFRTQMQSL